MHQLQFCTSRLFPFPFRCWPDVLFCTLLVSPGTNRYSRSRHSLVRLQLGDREALHHQLEQIEHERQACPALPALRAPP